MDGLHDKARSGEPLRIPADVWNTLLDVAQEYRKGQLSLRSGATVQPRPVSIGMVRNNSGADWPRFAAVALRETMFVPADAAFMDLLAFEGYTAELEDIDRWPQRIGITLEPISDGGIGSVLYDGLAPCQVSMTDADDRFAGLEEGLTLLESRAAGSVEVVWTAGGSGTQWAIVRLGGRGAAIETANPGALDTPVGPIAVYMIQADQESGLDLVDVGNGVGTLVLTDAREDHNGVVNLTDEQHLGAGRKRFHGVQAVASGGSLPATRPTDTVIEASTGGITYLAGHLYYRNSGGENRQVAWVRPLGDGSVIHDAYISPGADSGDTTSLVLQLYHSSTGATRNRLEYNRTGLLLRDTGTPFGPGSYGVETSAGVSVWGASATASGFTFNAGLYTSGSFNGGGIANGTYPP